MQRHSHSNLRQTHSININKITVDKINVDKMPVDKMPVDKMPVDKMPVDKMTCCPIIFTFALNFKNVISILHLHSGRDVIKHFTVVIY